MTSWGHLGDILGTYLGHIEYILESSLGPLTGKEKVSVTSSILFNKKREENNIYVYIYNIKPKTSQEAQLSNKLEGIFGFLVVKCCWLIFEEKSNMCLLQR